ncbi:MAG: hypothetical protein IJD51_06695 [Clostridia bacterium]|nr:hypothetical protein [Clostridia bacterium]
MAKGIYTYYKERLVEIGGSSRCIYLKSIVRKNAYDLGRIFEGREAKVSEFIDFLWTGGKHPLTLIGAKEKREILENIDIESRIVSAQAKNPYAAESDKVARSPKRADKDRAIELEVSKLKDLVRQTEEIERDTGRYELFVGYPFVFGAINQGGKRLKIKAPLLLFPVKVDFVDDSTVELRFNEKEKIHINPALVYAYAQSKRVNIDSLELDFDDLSAFRSVKDVTDYLLSAGIRIDVLPSRNVYDYSRFKEPDDRYELSVRYAAVLARFPLSNSIYNDYTALEKKKLTNNAINELLRSGKIKKAKKERDFSLFRLFKRKKDTPATLPPYTVKPLDFAQSEVVRRVGECGNMVIYGPPGTGKSQTIVNVITDALSAGRRVLVVSQKKAALDVVYNRLGTLNDRCMYITDEGKEKRAFYERALAAHLSRMGAHTAEEGSLRAEYASLSARLDEEIKSLEAISHTFCDKRPFGLSLIEMYSSSNIIAKNSIEYGVYLKLTENSTLMSLDYKELSEALFAIKDESLEKTYYNYTSAREKNPLLSMTQSDVDIRTVSEVRGKLEAVQKSRRTPFDCAKYPLFPLVMAHYKSLGDERVLDSIVKLECKKLYPKKLFMGKVRREMRSRLTETLAAIDEYAKDYAFLHLVFTDEAYALILDNLLRANSSYLKQVYEAIDGYVVHRDTAALFESFAGARLELLSFAYGAARSYAHYTEIIDRILPIRIYHELIYFEEACKEELSRTVDYLGTRGRILRLKEELEALSTRICALAGTHEYTEYYGERDNNKDFLYQISKKQKLWPIRKCTEVYGDYLMRLFPCWLLSPENVSSILPLDRGMFDTVIFDEASQVFIESTIPAIYRGKSIVVAGDSKQLRPSSTFMKRYLGTDPEAEEDPARQAALEVESLLDLAVARYESANLTYHYRSRHSELIDFSNSAFYSGKLQIAPNTSKNLHNRPIERIKVDGRWIERRNVEEADRIVALLSELFRTRKNNESIGIITFNSDQQSCIADRIDREAARNEEFRSHMLREKNRIEGGEDVSLFIKNLENVQGDERDIIIFSIGYAPNAEGKLHALFGSLSAEGGENRLNVAITRAKSKIYVVTSIEPEELRVDGAKNAGPRLLKQYLTYVRAVHKGSSAEVRAILDGLDETRLAAAPVAASSKGAGADLKERLEKMGYTVDTALGNQNSRISLAIYDRESDRYLVGVELDTDAFAASDSALERDVYKPRFLEARGWCLVRVWSRDVWLNPQRVAKQIAAIAEAQKK